MAETQEEKFRRMTEAPVGRLISKLAVPCIISMLVTSFYNMADTFFVGLLKSNSATGAVGVSFSMMAIIQAVGFFFGHGSGNYISRELGKKNYREAEKMAATGFFSAFAAGTLIMIIGEIFLEELALLLGSTETILPYTMEYLRAVLFGAPWITSSFVLNNQLRFQGNAAYAMVGITFGSVLNIALDPLLIFTFDMGIAGAGWATVISQIVGFFILLYGMQKRGHIKLRFSNIRFEWFYYKNIFGGGVPSLARQGLASVATISLNHAAGPYGDAVIAAMGIVQRIAMFGASTMIGFGQGFQPFCGFNYGAGLYKRVREGFFFCVKTSVVFLLGIAAVGFIFAPDIIALFRDDPDVIAVGMVAMRLQCVTFVTHSWIVLSNMMTQVIGRTVPATFLATARQGLFFIPAVLILSELIGVTGIQLAQPIADIGTLLCAIPIQIKILKEMDSKLLSEKENI
ncbi:MAG: MATE family efflux transporter [Oscillospiraceae bacterium]|nr:MATE family efflux transporter [Oscillospiraceae bacterium]